MTHEPGMVVVCDTVDFLKKFDRHYTQRTSDKEYKRGVFQALQECHKRAGNKVGSSIDSNDVKSLLIWAQKGFPLRDGNRGGLAMWRVRNFPHGPVLFLCILGLFGPILMEKGPLESEKGPV